MKAPIQTDMQEPQAVNARADGRVPLLGNFVCGSDAMQAVVRQLVRIAPFRTTVLIMGESGCGKEQVARLIHLNSHMRNLRMVTLNCAAVPETLLESELFGYARGAFSGAARNKPGIFEEADGGTLLLDEISEFPLMLQAKLLRILQEGTYRRLGEVEERSSDARVIATSSKDLEQEVRAGRFREDLYYRLSVFPIDVPPLRQRREDIPGLVRHFIRMHAGEHSSMRVSDGAMAQLMRYPWPGNVRELQNKIERAVVLADSEYIEIDVTENHVMQDPSEFTLRIPDAQVSIKQTMADLVPRIEQELIRRALRETRNNRTRAARLLEISHRSLLYKLKAYNCG